MKEGDTGHADDAIRKYCAGTGKNSSAFLCGSPKMIESLTAALKEVGVAEDKIYFDNF